MDEFQAQIKALDEELEESKKLYLTMESKYSSNLWEQQMKIKTIEQKLKGAYAKMSKSATSYWTFTEDEKAFLRALPKKYSFIMRGGNDYVVICTKEPIIEPYGSHYEKDKEDKDAFWIDKCVFKFDTVRNNDPFPCTFRDYI